MSDNAATASWQYLTFKLENDGYAVNVESVREILDLCPITKVPQTPDFMLGVINLRGGVVPVVDLRVKFGFAAAAQSELTCIIVVEVMVDGDLTILGVLVDSVQEVLEIDEMEPPPRIGNRLKTEFIHGMGKRGDTFVIVLDINRIFSTSELTLLQQPEEDVALLTPEMAAL